MKKNKQRIVLSAVLLLCLCLCLSACCKTNVATKEPDKIETRTDQKADNTKDTDSGNSIVKDSDQEITHQGNGSGVETIDSIMDEQNPSNSTSIPKPTTAPTPTPKPTTPNDETAEAKYEQGVEPISDPTDPVKPTEEEAPVTPSSPALSSAAQEYANYCAMSSEEQYAYYKKFASADAFMSWYNAAKAAYEKENPAIVLEPGAAIDLSGN